jgi:DNA-binding NtrC family response regulator
VSPPPHLRELLDRLVHAMVDGQITLDEGRRAFEARFIEHALDACDGHLSNTADRIGLHRNTLARKIAEYRIKTG